MLSLEFSEKYEPLFTTKARYIDLWGGRGRGGSYTGTKYFVHLLTQKEYFRGYLMREIAGDIRESLWRDFKDRIEEDEIEHLFEINETAMSAICVPTGNVLLSKGFKKSSGNRTAKLKSLAGATHVLIEEAEEISDWLMEEDKNSDACFDEFKDFYKEHIYIFTEQIKKLIFETSSAIANSFSGKNKAELILLGKLRLLFTGAM